MTSCRSKTLLLQDHFLSHDKAFRALPSGFGQTATPHSNAWGIPLLQDLVRTFQRFLLGAQPHSDGLLDRCAHKDLNAPCCSSGSASLQFVLLSTLMEARWHTGVCTSHHVGQRCCMDDESSPVHGILSSGNAGVDGTIRLSLSRIGVQLTRVPENMGATLPPLPLYQ